MSYTYEQLQLLGGVLGTYRSQSGATKRILGLVDPLRRMDGGGNVSFLPKTFELYISKDASEGVEDVRANFDTFTVKLRKSDSSETTLRITKIAPDLDDGTPGDGVGMWKLEAVQ